MADGELSTVVRHIRKLAALRSRQEMTDRQLLHEFLAASDDLAFAALVKRHGPLVLAVSRRVLNHSQDAEDAFQATFLVLAQNAASIRKTEALAGWLHGVAYRIALKAKRDAARRRAREKEVQAVPNRGSSSDLAWTEVQVILDEEIQRLPTKYRAAFVMCCLEGKHRAEVAKELGLKEGTVRSRLWQARQQLQQRLSRRGVTLSALLGAVAISESTIQAAVPTALAAATVRYALLLVERCGIGFQSCLSLTGLQSYPAGGAPGEISAKVAALVKGATKPLIMTKVKLVALLFLAGGLAAAGVGVLAQRELPIQQAAQIQADLQIAKTKKDNQQEFGTEKQGRTDQYGDPLPAGAIARVGTVRFRHGSQVYCLAFSPDGRFIASGSFHGELCLWERATGKLVRRFVEPVHDDRIRFVTAVAFSPDGRILASNKGTARLWDVRSGKLLRDLDESIFGHVCSMAFSHDSKALALGTGKGIWLYDLTTGQARRPIPGYIAIVPMVVFSKDGKVLASASTENTGRNWTARIWNLASGEEIRRFEPHDRIVEVALSPDGKLLAAQTTQQVLLWEVATGKEVRRFQAERHLRSLAFSPDGTRLACANVIWDVSTGKEICRLEGIPRTSRAWEPDGKALVPVTGSFGGLITGALDFAPDGKVLVSGGYDGVVRLHDPASGKELPPANLFPWNRGMIGVCGFAPDGRWLAVCDNGGIHLCETASGKEIHRLPIGDDSGVPFACLLPVSLPPHGRMLVAAGGKAIYRWDTSTGKELGRTPNPRKWDDLGGLAALAFAPDGRTFACAHHEPTIRLWDTATAQELGQFQGHETGIRQLFFSPDGKRLASESGNRTIQIWDVATRKELQRWSLPAGGVQAFAPDGRTVVAGGRTEWGPGSEGENLLVIYDLVSGKPLRRFGGIESTYCAFSADGKLLAVDADPYYYPDRPRTIQLLEMASGKVRGLFMGHFGFPGQMVFSPDGRMLATSGSDSTALIWDVTGRLREGSLLSDRLSPDDLKMVWSDLAADDAQAAHRAVWTLAAAPRLAVPLLKEKLVPAPVGKLPHIERLIDDLRSNHFAIREKAADELEQLGDIAEPTLRKTLADKPSLEVRRRVEQLLEKVSVSGERLQRLRAVEVLEHIATVEAQELLGVLAQGAPEAQQTQEAKASLERLTKRPVASP